MNKSKFDSVLDFLSIKSDIVRSSLSSIFEFTITQIKYKYDQESLQDKIAAVYVVKEIYLNNGDLEKEDIINIIDKFFEYKKGYQDYLDTLAIITDQFDADLTFYNIFVNQYLTKQD